MSWHKPHNISGTIHCGDRLNEMYDLYRDLLGSDDVFLIGHFTGAVSVCGQSSSVHFITTGFDVHDAFFLVYGDRSQWLEFAATLEDAMNVSAIACSIRVHETTETFP